MTNSLPSGDSLPPLLPTAIFTTCRWTPNPNADALLSIRDIPLIDRHLDRLYDAFTHLSEVAKRSGSPVYNAWPGRQRVEQEIEATVTARSDGDWRVSLLLC